MILPKIGINSGATTHMAPSTTTMDSLVPLPRPNISSSCEISKQHQLSFKLMRNVLYMFLIWYIVIYGDLLPLLQMMVINIMLYSLVIIQYLVGFIP